MTHNVTFSDRNQAIIDKARLFIEQKFARRQDAMVEYTDAIQSVKDAQESLNERTPAIAAHVLTLKTEALRHADLMLDASFLEFYESCKEIARQEMEDEQRSQA